MDPAMTTDQLKAVEDYLKKEYYLVRREVLGILIVVLGSLQIGSLGGAYTAAKIAISTGAAAIATSDIEKMKNKSNDLLVDIQAKRDEANNIVKFLDFEKARVPLGAMIPYFGTDLPKGFVWADGMKEFPKADWVPEHLRGGAKVPDMREYLVGGAKDKDNVGLTYSRGEVSIAGTTISGSSFSLPAPTEYRIATGDGGRKKEGGFVVILNHNLNYNGEVFWNGFGANGENGFGWGVLPRPAIYTSFPKGTKLEGSTVIADQTIKLDQGTSLPRHVMCRWIIRVE